MTRHHSLTTHKLFLFVTQTEWDFSKQCEVDWCAAEEETKEEVQDEQKETPEVADHTDVQLDEGLITGLTSANYACLTVSQRQEAVNMFCSDNAIPKMLRVDPVKIDFIAQRLEGFCISNSVTTLSLTGALVLSFLMENGVSPAQAPFQAKIMDMNNDGVCDFREIVATCMRFQDPSQKPKANAEMLFQHYDQDQNGTLSMTEVSLVVFVFYF